MTFKKEVQKRIISNSANRSLQKAAHDLMKESLLAHYSYNFSSIGRPIIQYPQDMVAVQELIWSIKPDLIIETGIAHGGSLVMNAAMLAMLDYCDAAVTGESLDPKISQRRVLGLDIEIRPHNRAAIEAHPLAHKIEMIEGDSISPEIVEKVHKIASKYDRILVMLDSNHTHEHVLAELEAYAPLTTRGSYCVVFDTIVENMPAEMFPDRPWGPGNNPKTAVREYFRRLTEEGRKAADGLPLKYELDEMIENKLVITVAPEGYLRRI
ncbi:cephalosporin hydroxylase family protein [Anoxynatronum sibiricum]|uniref:Cephalosporin hydroxylase family protein n=1 Tax=Anoxynatronum sibiricum TaxID=210623 RepID=A0ABU9VUG2_9CLOT